MSNTPPLGPEGDAATTRLCGMCTEIKADGSWLTCGKQAAAHIFWTPELENGYACKECFPEAVTRWDWYAWHPLGPCCGMPESLFYEAENVCRYEDGLPVVEHEHALAAS